MVEKFSYKLIGLIGAVLIYIALLTAIYYAIVSEEKKKKDYGFNVEEAIVVDIDTLVKEEPKPVTKPAPKPSASIPVRAMPLTPPKPQPQKPEQKPIPEPLEEKTTRTEPKPKEEKALSEKKESRDKMAKSAKDLFSTVRTDRFKKAMEEKRRQKEARASRLKKQEAEKARKRALARKKALEKKRREAARKAREAQRLLEELQISQTSKRHRKKGAEHEFWSFVSDKIMAKWNRTIETATDRSLKGSVIIRIDNKGNLTYRNLKLSGNSLFDTKLKVFLDNLEYTRFPAYKNGPYIEAEFEFKDQVKGN